MLENVPESKGMLIIVACYLSLWMSVSRLLGCLTLRCGGVVVADGSKCVVST